ncbi:MAG: amidase [Rhodospirillales bacterium]|nr:amidase [Rhodospirillales bacterium]
MNDTDIAFMPASDLATEIRAGRISSLDATENVLARIEASRETLNAFITVMDDTARRDARRADDAAAKGQSLGPLHGVPISVKDLINIKGLPTTFGSQLMTDNIAPADAVSVARLKAAGAVIVGKTTTPDNAHKLLTDAPLFGITRNPWDLDLTPGGSSGGSAAAVAAGIGPISLATDAGASTRLPAACTGVVGLKPTLGLVPHNQVPDGFQNFIHLGIFSRTITDCALTLGVLAGEHGSDPLSMGVPTGEFMSGLSNASVKGLRFAFRPLLGNEILAAEVRAACEKAAGVFEKLGGVVTQIDEAFENAEPTWRVLQQSNWAVRFGKDMEENADRMDSSLVEGIREGLSYSGPDLQRAMYGRTRLFRAVQAWFGDTDFVLTPTISRRPLKASHKALDPIEIDGQDVGDMRRSWCPYLNLFNLTGHPAISIPCGWTDDGLPIGLQIIGRWFADADLLAVAAAFEAAQPWADRRPPHIPK